MASLHPPKNPIKVRAGKAGAESRWGPDRRSVRLVSLNPPQRRLVLALIAAAELENGVDR